MKMQNIVWENVFAALCIKMYVTCNLTDPRFFSPDQIFMIFIENHFVRLIIIKFIKYSVTRQFK